MTKQTKYGIDLTLHKIGLNKSILKYILTSQETILSPKNDAILFGVIILLAVPLKKVLNAGFWADLDMAFLSIADPSNLAETNKG